MNKTWRFVLHFLEMVVAMVVGMILLGPVVALAGGQLGWSATLQQPDVSALVMAFDMTVGMSLWMWLRGHSRAGIVEMGAAMFVPFLVLLVPYWAGVISGEALLGGGHVLMLPAMLIAMLWRRDVYTGDHRELARATA